MSNRTMGSFRGETCDGAQAREPRRGKSATLEKGIA
jgi:hypothetical protein